MAQQTIILLSGSLAKRFGRKHIRYLDTGTTHEAFSALKHTLKGFQDFISQQAKKGLKYAVWRNRENTNKEDDFTLAGTRELRIVPIIEGSKRGGALQIIVGAVLIVAGIAVNYFTGGTAGTPFIQAGAAMVAGGVVQMLSPQMKGLSGREASENTPSYAFGGPVNTTAAGNIVPIFYGKKRRIGGAIISAGIYAEDLNITQFGGGNGGGGNGGGEQQN